MKIPQLETERLVMRAVRPEDIDQYAKFCADIEVMKYLGGRALPRWDAWRHLAFLAGHWELRGYGMWAVVERATNQFIGRVGFNYPEGWPAFEIGWMLGRDYWGRGFATEAARAALEFGVRNLKQRHVISLINKDNQNSIAVAKRLGESHEGQTTIMDSFEVEIYGLDLSPVDH